MKYTIYKLNKELGGNRWWRNYDTNHRNLPDIDIETYLTNKGYSWVELKNTRNEKIGYQTLSKDSYDTIQLYINDFKEIPEYIKIEFEISSDKKESLYYYIDVTPMIYNSRDKLAAEAIYTLDKSVPFYTFHKYLVEKNPQMFYVQKHYDRMLESNGSLYFDMNLQPWYMNVSFNQPNLLVEDKKTYTGELITVLNLENIQDTNYSYTIEDYQELPVVTATNKNTGDKIQKFYHDDPTPELQQTGYWSDDIFFFQESGQYEYLITKPVNAANKRLDEFYYWPILRTNSYHNSQFIGRDNTLLNLFTNFPEYFTNDTIVGRFLTTKSPSVLALDSRTLKVVNNNYLEASNVTWGLQGTVGDNKQWFRLELNGIPKEIELAEGKFLESINTCISNFNNGNVLKTKENNPHLLAPQYKQFVYATTSNDKITITSDMIDCRTTDNKLVYGMINTTDMYSRIRPKILNSNKIFSQNGNEVTICNYRQAPIECSAFNNTWLQRQALDTSRNTTIAKDATGMAISALMIPLSLMLAATGFGAPVAAMGIAGGIGGLIKSTVGLGAGQAQYNRQISNLYAQPNTLNAPIGVSGLSSIGWNNNNESFYTMSLSEQDATVINNEDNMYGYKVNKWLPYSDYLTCWDGNYMLCDMTKNYNSIFNILKGMNSIWTKSDTYINQFIEALNNGVTWFTDGDYVDLATDLFNFERTRSGSITRPASVTELIKYGGHYSYNVTASYFNVKDLNLDHYSIKSITGYTDATLSVENNEVVCTVKRTRAVACNIEVEVAYKLWTSKYWTVTSTDTFAWVSEPTGTYSIRIALPYYTKTCKVTVIHNGEKDLDTSHYAVLGGTKYIGKEFRVVEGSDVWLYAATQAKDAYENIKIQYVSDGKDWLTSTKQLVLRGSL